MSDSYTDYTIKKQKNKKKIKSYYDYYYYVRNLTKRNRLGHVTGNT